MVWLQRFSGAEDATVESMKHTTLATARLRFWRQAGTVGDSYGDHCKMKGASQQLLTAAQYGQTTAVCPVST